MSTPSPLVSIVIVNYRRREALIRSLDSARQQSYTNREIIVVDNNSGDGTAEFVAAYAPEVRTIPLTENTGAGGGRNAGILAARGDIIITVDNDIFFETPFEVSKTVETFARRPDVHMLAYQLCDERTGALRIREWCHPHSWLKFAEVEFETNYFIEGACAARREVYETAGLYYEPLFIGCEGWDLALRILDHGFRILHDPHIRLRHLMSAETRTPERPYYYYTRNYIWIAYKDYPFGARIPFLCSKLAMMCYFALRSRRFGAFLRGVKAGVVGLGEIRKDRTPIKRATVAYLRTMERWRPTLWTRFRRHREAVQI